MAKSKKHHTLEYSAPAKEVMLMKITKKKFLQLGKKGIDREEFEDLCNEVEYNTIFYAQTYEKGGYDVDLYLDGKPIPEFSKHLEKLLEAGRDDSEPEVAISPTHKNRVNYYINWERFFKAIYFKGKVKGDFSLDKIEVFIPQDVLIGDERISGFELSYDGKDLEETSLDFGSDEMYLISSAGQRLVIDVHD